MGKPKFKVKVAGEKGAVATGIIVLSLFLQAKVSVYVPEDVVNSLPENTLAVAFAGSLAALWNALKFRLKTLK